MQSKMTQMEQKAKVDDMVNAKMKEAEALG